MKLAKILLLHIAAIIPLPALAQTGGVTWDKTVEKNFSESAWFGQGIAFVGNWEPLNFRIRLGGETDPAAAYDREHRLETVLKLKQAGVNFIITHFYKTGILSDRQSMEDTKKFVALCHEHGIRVGAYIGGTMFAETMLRDVPEAREWVRYDEYNIPVRYGRQSFRYAPDFNHPGYVGHMKKIIEAAVADAGVDFVHFDNMSLYAPPNVGNTPDINRRFREFLANKYSEEELQRRLGYGFADLRSVTVPSWHGNGAPAAMSPITDPLIQEWVDFRCADFAGYYNKLAAYARSLNPAIVVELNPHGILGRNRAFLNGIDHARLLPHGSAFWSEEPNEAQLTRDGVLVSKIRSYKLSQALDQTMFSYTGMQRADNALRSYRLLMAESMAYNRNSIGCLGEPLDAAAWPGDMLSYIRFFHRENIYYQDMRAVADVALLRSFPSLSTNGHGPQIETTLMEQLLIQSKIPFALIFDQNLADLSKYKVLVMADQESLSERAVRQIRDFVARGGGLVATGNTSRYNDWRHLRADFALSDVLGVHCSSGKDLPQARRRAFERGRAVYIPRVIPAKPITPAQLRAIAASGFTNAYWKLPSNTAEIVEAIKYAAGTPFSVEFSSAPMSTVMEIKENPSRTLRVLHWINFDLKKPVPESKVSAAIPPDRSVVSVRLVSPEKKTVELPCKMENGRVHFTMPQLEVYNVAVIEMRPAG